MSRWLDKHGALLFWGLIVGVALATFMTLGGAA